MRSNITLLAAVSLAAAQSAPPGESLTTLTESGHPVATYPIGPQGPASTGSIQSHTESGSESHTTTMPTSSDSPSAPKGLTLTTRTEDGHPIATYPIYPPGSAPSGESLTTLSVGGTAVATYPVGPQGSSGSSASSTTSSASPSSTSASSSENGVAPTLAPLAIAGVFGAGAAAVALL